MTHEELRDLIPAYALDALEPEAARAVEAHLPGCDECREELSSLQAVAAELAVGIAPVEPPAELRERVLAGVRPRFPVIEPSRLWRVGLAAAAALILILGGVTLVQVQRIRTLTATMGTLSSRLAAQERVLAVLGSPTSRTAALHGSVQANVRFVYDRAAGQGALVVTDLRDPGAGFVYQVWLVAGQEPQSAGVFRPIPGQPIVVPVNADFRRYQAVAISVERGPQGSAAGPTTVPILNAAI
jgi:anti-sigma-K factor RskA